MAMNAFVPLTTDGGRGNDGAGAKPSGRTARPARPMLRAVVRMAAEVAAQPVRWLWTDHLALGKIAVVAGAANVGKSLLVTGDFAARVSVGSPWPDGSACPAGDVLIASGHDGAADTIVPRLLEHGAELRRVHFLQGFTRADADACTNHAGLSGTGAHLLLTPGGVPLLDRALRRLPEAKLVVFDPVSAFLDGGNGTRARHVLSALQDLAERCGAAFVLVAGLRDGTAKGRLAVAAPAGLVSAARHLWVVARDRAAEQRPSADSTGSADSTSSPRASSPQASSARASSGLRPSTSSGLRRLFMPARNNLGGESHGYAWTIAEGKVRWEASRLERAGFFDSLLEEASRFAGQRDAAATGFIADFLNDGPRTWGAIALHGKTAGHKPGTLERVRTSVAETFKRKERDGRWLWRLIGDDRTSSEGDIADFFGGGGFPIADGLGLGPLPPLDEEDDGYGDLEDDEEDDPDYER